MGLSQLVHYNYDPVVSGILGDVLIDNMKHPSWKAYSLEFKYSFVARCVASIIHQLLSQLISLSIESGGLWKRTPATGNPGPALYKSSFSIRSEPKDTFADMTVSYYTGYDRGACNSYTILYRVLEISTETYNLQSRESKFLRNL